MASTSHARCKQCGGIRHKNVRSGLCGRCWAEYEKPRIRAEQAAVKARRLARNGIHRGQQLDIVLDAIEIKVEEEIAVPSGPKPRYSDEQKIEIAKLYEDGKSYSAIKNQTGANASTVVETVKALGGTLRKDRQNGHVEPPIPEVTARDISRLEGSVPPSPIAEPSGGEVWIVTYEVVTRVTRSDTVTAGNFTQAADMVYANEPTAEIIEISKVRI